MQVTLQIVKALIEKTPRDLPLYASAVLRILRTVLESKDLTMIEETVPTFEAFCIAQEPGVLSADQSFMRQYDEIIALYSAFASKDTPFESKMAKTIPSIIRYRKAGLEALKALSSSDILIVETERQLHRILPPILENVYSDNGQFLNQLGHREEEKHEQEKDFAMKRRQSISTVRTAETEPDPVAASGTTEAADQLAEQETGVIALQALKNIFTNAPRGQLRVVATEVLRWVSGRVKPGDHFHAVGSTKLVAGSWPCTLFSLISTWAPVQDRYVILVTAMDILIKSPITEKDLDSQYTIAVIVGFLLSSSINFIGLSVMDVLVGLVQHILLLLQLGGPGTSVQPLPQANGLDYMEHTPAGVAEYSKREGQKSCIDAGALFAASPLSMLQPNITLRGISISLSASDTTMVIWVARMDDRRQGTIFAICEPHAATWDSTLKPRTYSQLDLHVRQQSILMENTVRVRTSIQCIGPHFNMSLQSHIF